MKNLLYLSISIFIVFVFFRPFLFQQELPIPSDTIVGLYHPFLDSHAKEYPNGIPFKNYLITDPVRQQFPWRFLSINLLKQSQLPLWNPYSFSGTPLLANFQTGALYPFNILFLILPFSFSWSILVFFQSLLAGIFMFFYLKNLKISSWSAILGGVIFAFCGFSISWLEWNTILHVALWLPLILLATDNLVKKISLIWIFILIFAQVSQIFAGHIQVLFYSFLITASYLLVRINQSLLESKKRSLFAFVKKLTPFLLLGVMIFTITSIEWIPTLQFISESARSIDQNYLQKEGWFIPWQHLIQFIAPDFFGNPTTLNYWGTWNYAELVGYIGILPLIFSVYALFFRKDKKTFFFGILFFLSLIFSLPTIFAKLPYLLNIPFISTSQPTRLLFIIDFSLASLSAFGCDYFLKNRKKNIFIPLIFFAFIFALLWVFISFQKGIVSLENVAIAKRNLFPPVILFLISTILLLLATVLKKPNRILPTILPVIIVVIVAFDLFRFGSKFTPFTKQEYLFPQTKTIEFLQKNLGDGRFMTTDSRIFPPNFSSYYKMQSVDGYDPLFLKRYGELIVASERGKPDISQPFGFNRIITPHNFNSKIIDLLGVKYVLSLDEKKSPSLMKVFEEGQTKVYENKNIFPKAFFVENVQSASTKQEAINKLFSADLKKQAIVEGFGQLPKDLGVGKVTSFTSAENKVSITTESKKQGFLVITDTFYPNWKAQIDGRQSSIYRTDYNFRGISVPAGMHTIIFYITLF